MTKYKKGDKVSVERYGKVLSGTIEREFDNNVYCIKLENGKKLIVKEDELKIPDPTKEMKIPDKAPENKKEKEKEEELDSLEPIKKPVKKEKIHEVSFSVVSYDKANSFENSHETIIHGTTKDGVKFKASLLGIEASRYNLENIATRIAIGVDAATSRQDKSYERSRLESNLSALEEDIVVVNGISYNVSEFTDDLALHEAERAENPLEQIPEMGDFSSCGAEFEEPEFSDPGQDITERTLF